MFYAYTDRDREILSSFIDKHPSAIEAGKVGLYVYKTASGQTRATDDLPGGGRGPVPVPDNYKGVVHGEKDKVDLQKTMKLDVNIPYQKLILDQLEKDVDAAKAEADRMSPEDQSSVRDEVKTPRHQAIAKEAQKIVSSIAAAIGGSAAGKAATEGFASASGMAKKVLSDSKRSLGDAFATIKSEAGKAMKAAKDNQGKLLGIAAATGVYTGGLMLGLATGAALGAIAPLPVAFALTIPITALEGAEMGEVMKQIIDKGVYADQIRNYIPYKGEKPTVDMTIDKSKMPSVMLQKMAEKKIAEIQSKLIKMYKLAMDAKSQKDNYDKRKGLMEKQAAERAQPALDRAEAKSNAAKQRTADLAVARANSTSNYNKRKEMMASSTSDAQILDAFINRVLAPV